MAGPWYVWSGATGSANGLSWANAFIKLAPSVSGAVAGDTVYVAHDHNETTAGSITLNFAGTVANPIKVICANRAGSVPPVSADRRATAQVASSGSINTNGFMIYDGIIFSCSSTQGFQIANATNERERFDNCSFRLLAGTSQTIGIATQGQGNLVEFNNSTVSFFAVGQSVAVGGVFKWRNTPSALLGVAPTALFKLGASWAAEIEGIGVDLSAAGAGTTLFASAASLAKYRLVDCKLNAAATKAAVPGAHGCGDVDIIRSGVGNYAVFCQRFNGNLEQETTIVRTGGATDATTPLSWKVITTVNANYLMPFESPPIAIWCDTTGSAKTATIECIGTAIATDQEVWLDLEYLGDASSPQGSFVNDAKADLLATAVNQTTSSATWGGALTGKFKINVTFTAQQKGWVYARVKCAKASSTFYIDPLITLT